jgi:putative membrane protein
VNVITLGLFTFVVNALMIWLASTVVKGFDVAGFTPALLAAVLLWAASVVTSALLKEARRN